MDTLTDTATAARAFQTMVAMRDGTRLNTFVFLPASGGVRFPVILHRTPYGIAAADARDKFDAGHAWLPSAAEPMRMVTSAARRRDWIELTSVPWVPTTIAMRLSYTE